MAKKQENYLDRIPIQNQDFTIDDAGIVTVLVVWKGFYHRIAQRFFHRPRVSEIKLDDYGSWVWQAIDGQKDVHALSQEMHAHFGDMEKGLSRLMKFLEIMHDHRLIRWQGEAHK